MKYKASQPIAKPMCQFPLITIRKRTFCFIVSDYWTIRWMRFRCTSPLIQFSGSRINNSVIKIWQTKGAKGFDCNSCLPRGLTFHVAEYYFLTASDILSRSTVPKRYVRQYLHTPPGKLTCNRCRWCHTCIQGSKFVPQDPRRVMGNFLIKDIFLISTWTAGQWNCPQL